ncbi:MAG: MFS transporter [Thermodesulfobacteriota bacterium]
MNLFAIFGGTLPLFVLGHFSHHILTAITVPLTPFIRSTFDLDYTQAGLLASAFSLAYGFGQLPAGWLADRMESRKLMLVGISGVALAGVLVGLSRNYGWMIIFLVLMGILAGGYHPSAPPLISATVGPENLGRSLGFHNIGGGASYFLAPLVAVAVANAWGWRNAYVALGIPTTAFGIAFYMLLGRRNARQKAAPAPRPAKGNDTAPPRFDKRRLVGFLFLTTVTSGLISSAFSFIPLLMVDHLGVSKEMAAASLSVPFSAVFWASPLGGHLADRFGSVRMVLAVSFIAGPAVFLLTVLPFGWTLGALLLLFGVIIYTRMSAAESFIIHQTPAGIRSTILGIYYFTAMEGSGVFTPVVGYLIDNLGFTKAFAAVGCALLAATLICSFWLREKRK